MLRVIMILNTLATIVAVAFAIVIQQMSPMMLHDMNFVLFRDRISDEDRLAILLKVPEVFWVGLFPLIVTSAVWIGAFLLAEVLRFRRVPGPKS